jgi:regulator of protease activity HflC (stomatin/prohibitin superfamily)
LRVKEGLRVVRLEVCGDELQDGGGNANYVDTSLLFRLDKTMAAQVYQTVGADYVEKIVVIVENVLLRDVQLPAMLKGSIEAKQQAEQDALRMSFILQKEKQEAERKRIEAQGIADFQKIVAAGISTQLLEWKGIEATEKLAASSNAKVVIIGNPKNGLPLVLEPK